MLYLALAKLGKITRKTRVVSVFQIMPVLPTEADIDLCRWTDIACPAGRVTLGLGSKLTSLELLGPQKSFIYQNLQNFVKKIAGLFSKRSLQNFLRYFKKRLWHHGRGILLLKFRSKCIKKSLFYVIKVITYL